MTRGCEEPRQLLGSGRWSQRCLEHDRAKARTTMPTINARWRERFLTAYGGRCWCCGLDDRRFLSMAHTFNDGAAHRQRLGKRGPIALMRDLAKRGWPRDEGIAVECFNCNMGAARNGGTCPHQED